MRSKLIAAWFTAGWLFIAITSGYDAYRCVQDRQVLIDLELNPMAIALITAAGGDVKLLVACKVIGTAIALGVFCSMYYRKYRYTGVIMLVVVLAQAFVLMTYCPRIWG